MRAALEGKKCELMDIYIAGIRPLNTKELKINQGNHALFIGFPSLMYTNVCNVHMLKTRTTSTRVSFSST